MINKKQSLKKLSILTVILLLTTQSLFATQKKQINIKEISELKFLLNIIPNGSPLKHTKVTSPYGFRIHPVTKRKSFHNGIDFRAKIGTSIFATADGVVTFAGKSRNPNRGTMVIIKHTLSNKESFKTTFLHLSKTLVKKGDIVYKGEKIALSGNTGRGTGPHLHYAISLNNNSVDPSNYLKWSKDNFSFIFKKSSNSYPVWKKFLL